MHVKHHHPLCITVGLKLRACQCVTASCARIWLPNAALLTHRVTESQTLGPHAQQAKFALLAKTTDQILLNQEGPIITQPGRTNYYSTAPHDHNRHSKSMPCCHNHISSTLNSLITHMHMDDYSKTCCPCTFCAYRPRSRLFTRPCLQWLPPPHLWSSEMRATQMLSWHSGRQSL